MKIKLDENNKVIAVLYTGDGDGFIDAPELPFDHEFGIKDYSYISNEYIEVNSVESSTGG